MAAAKPRRAVLRKAPDSDIHPAEPRVKAASVRARAAVPPSAGARKAAGRAAGGRSAKD
jgi:hypothetical protein